MFLKKRKMAILILKIFLISLFLGGCTNNKFIYTPIPKELTKQVKKPSPPKVNQKIKTEIAIFMIEQDYAIDLANEKLKMIRILDSTINKIINKKD